VRKVSVCTVKKSAARSAAFAGAGRCASSATVDGATPAADRFARSRRSLRTRGSGARPRSGPRPTWGARRRISAWTSAVPSGPAARECRPEATVPVVQGRPTLRTLVDGQLMAERQILEDKISPLPREQPRGREQQPEREPHARTRPAGGSRNLRLAPSDSGSSIRAPQVSLRRRGQRRPSLSDQHRLFTERSQSLVGELAAA